jgi:hypothetical protein
MDIIEEGLKINNSDSRSESSRTCAYREHVEGIHEYLSESVSDKIQAFQNIDSNNGKSTLGSTGFKSSSQNNGESSKSKRFLNSLGQKQHVQTAIPEIDAEDGKSNGSFSSIGAKS